MLQYPINSSNYVTIELIELFVFNMQIWTLKVLPGSSDRFRGQFSWVESGIVFIWVNDLIGAT